VAATPTQGAPVNHWAILGLDPGADAVSLKRAFRQQARRWHPDLNGNNPHAEEQFKAVNEAYAVLSDPARREQWERGIDPAQAAAALKSSLHKHLNDLRALDTDKLLDTRYDRYRHLGVFEEAGIVRS
jgi:curved DNA-binding protein CbpA